VISKTEKFSRPREILLTGNEAANLNSTVAESVIAEVDGMPVVEWTGDSSQLSQDPKYAMPRTDWLYLASWNTQSLIRCFGEGVQ
jgi:hypothetical protein